MASPIDISLHALNTKSVLALALVGVLPLLGVFAVAIWANGGRPPKGVAPIVLITAALIAGLGLWQLASVRMRLDATSLTVGGGLYCVSVPLDRVIEGGVEIEPAESDALRLRTNGIGMPGLLLGWFDLRGGGKAFVAITDSAKVVRIPTRIGYTILVSPDDPDAVVDRLRRP